MPKPRSRFFWPLVIIVVGVLLLLQNLGLLPPGLWPLLLQLWPVGLILVGLDLLIGWRSPAAARWAVILTALVMAAALLYATLVHGRLPPRF
jgi:cell wall-active antibiotic response 4TMS protein YvqF